MDSLKIYMLSEKSRGKQNQDFPFGKPGYNDQIQNSVGGICFWTELASATFVAVIHNGCKIDFLIRKGL